MFACNRKRDRAELWRSGRSRTEAEPGRDLRILVVVTKPLQEQLLRAYAEALANSYSVEIGVLRDYQHKSLTSLSPAEGLASCVRGIYESWVFDMLLAEWPQEDEELFIYERLVKEIKARGILIRHSDYRPTRPSAGADACRNIVVVDAVAKEWSLKPKSAGAAKGASCFRSTHVTGRPSSTSTCSCREIAEELIFRSRRGGLIVVGSGSPWLIDTVDSASILKLPEKVCSCAVETVLTGLKEHAALADLFDDRTIRLCLEAPEKRVAVETLVEGLIETRKTASFSHSEIVAAVMDRERLGTTYIGHGTAIPHAALQGFEGVAGILGVFTQGVPFGRSDGEKARFVFLLATPKDSYDSYLPILSRIARFMSSPARRWQLAQAKDPEAVVELLGQTERKWQEDLLRRPPPEIQDLMREATNGTQEPRVCGATIPRHAHLSPEITSNPTKGSESGTRPGRRTSDSFGGHAWNR